MSYDGILGLDFFKKVKPILNIVDNDLRLINIMNEESDKIKVCVKNHTKVKSKSTILIEIKPLITNSEFFVKPCARIFDEFFLIFEKCLVNKSTKYVPINNENDFDVFLPANIKLGIGYKCSIDDNIFDCNHIHQIPESLDEIKSIEIKTENTDEKAIFEQFLLRYMSNFAFTPEQIGHAKGYKHHIDTEKCAPIKLRSYRLGYKEREEAEKQVAELLKNNLIRKSTSPWSTPIIMVHQKDKYRMV